jgi:hypothetical protein
MDISASSSSSILVILRSRLGYLYVIELDQRKCIVAVRALGRHFQVDRCCDRLGELWTSRDLILVDRYATISGGSHLNKWFSAVRAHCARRVVTGQQDNISRGADAAS